MTRPHELVQLLRRRPRGGRHCAPATTVLLALLDGPATPVRLLDAGRDLGCAPFGHGTLFGALARLEAAGLIEQRPADRTYRLVLGGSAS